MSLEYILLIDGILLVCVAQVFLLRYGIKINKKLSSIKEKQAILNIKIEEAKILRYFAQGKPLKPTEPPDRILAEHE